MRERYAAGFLCSIAEVNRTGLTLANTRPISSALLPKCVAAIKIN